MPLHFWKKKYHENLLRIVEIVGVALLLRFSRTVREKLARTVAKSLTPPNFPSQIPASPPCESLQKPLIALAVSLTSFCSGN